MKADARVAFTEEVYANWIINRILKRLNEGDAALLCVGAPPCVVQSLRSRCMQQMRT